MPNAKERSEGRCADALSSSIRVPNIRTVRNTYTLPLIVVNNFLNVQLDIIRFNIELVVDCNSVCDLSIEMDVL